MKPIDLVWLFLPDEVLPLLVVLLAVGVIVGIARPRHVLAIVVMIAVLPAISIVVDLVVQALPWYALLIVLLYMALTVCRLVLEVFLGREAAGHVFGVAIVAAMRLTAFLVAWVFRTVARGVAGGCRLLLSGRVVLALGLIGSLGCGKVERAVARSAARRAERIYTAPFGRILRRDLERDAFLPVRRLEVPRKVFRYTTRKQALREMREGIPASTHMTTVARAGRPLEPSRAMTRYGLGREPEVRMLIELPAGTRVRFGKVISGTPGVGEVTSPDHIPPSAILRIVELH